MIVLHRFLIFLDYDYLKKYILNIIQLNGIRNNDSILNMVRKTDHISTWIWSWRMKEFIHVYMQESIYATGFRSQHCGQISYSFVVRFSYSFGNKALRKVGYLKYCFTFSSFWILFTLSALSKWGHADPPPPSLPQKWSDFYERCAMAETNEK